MFLSFGTDSSNYNQSVVLISFLHSCLFLMKRENRQSVFLPPPMAELTRVNM